MIKRLQFLREPSGLHLDVADDVRPLHAVRCAALSQDPLPTGHQLVLEEWFADLAHLRLASEWEKGIANMHEELDRHLAR